MPGRGKAKTEGWGGKWFAPPTRDFLKVCAQIHWKVITLLHFEDQHMQDYEMMLQFKIIQLSFNCY